MFPYNKLKLIPLRMKPERWGKILYNWIIEFVKFDFSHEMKVCVCMKSNQIVYLCSSCLYFVQHSYLITNAIYSALIEFFTHIQRSFSNLIETLLCLDMPNQSMCELTHLRMQPVRMKGNLLKNEMSPKTWYIIDTTFKIHCRLYILKKIIE